MDGNGARIDVRPPQDQIWHLAGHRFDHCTFNDVAGDQYNICIHCCARRGPRNAAVEGATGLVQRLWWSWYAFTLLRMLWRQCTLAHLFGTWHIRTAWYSLLTSLIHQNNRRLRLATDFGKVTVHLHIRFFILTLFVCLGYFWKHTGLCIVY